MRFLLIVLLLNICLSSVDAVTEAIALARRADASDLLAELTGFGVRCVARRDDLPEGLDGIEGLDDTELHELRRGVAQMVIL